MTDNLARQPQLTVVDTDRQPPSRPALIVAEPPAPQQRSSRLIISKAASRWLSSALIALVVHAAPVAWWLLPSNDVGVDASAPAAMVVELAPMPTAPVSQPDMPPGPEQAESIVPPEPEPSPEPEPDQPPVPPAVKPEVAIKPQPKPKPEPIPPPEPLSPPLQEPQDSPPKEEPASTASAPPDAPQQDDLAAAPNQGVSAPTVYTHAVPDWQSMLMLKLNKVKRYPSRARRYRQEGITYLRFTMDREGNVLAKSIEQSSGYPLLDSETLALIDRAQPLPKPPAELSGNALEFVVPVEFFLNR